MERVLVTGASGLLGSKLIKVSNDYEIVGSYLKNIPNVKNAIRLDITDRKNIKSMARLKPNVIIHTAALTNVDYCEDHREDAWRINVGGTENIVELAEGLDAKMVYISTDYIFDGKDGPYNENDTPNPINYYGRTKLEGEKIVRKLNDYIIARSTVIYGWQPFEKSNFVTWVIDQLERKQKINTFTDQLGNPTLADNLAEVIFELIRKDKKGIYNVVGSSYVSRYDFALKIAEIFNLDNNLIKPITSDELVQRAPRPRKAGLKTNKIRKELNVKLLTIKEGLLRMKEQKVSV